MKDEQACSDAEACTYLELTVNAIELDVFYVSRIYAGSSYLVWPCLFAVWTVQRRDTIEGLFPSGGFEVIVMGLLSTLTKVNKNQDPSLSDFMFWDVIYSSYMFCPTSSSAEPNQ